MLIIVISLFELLRDVFMFMKYTYLVKVSKQL